MICIINYNMGNIHSIKKKLDRIGVDVIVSSNYKDIEKSDKIILPGVGHFERAMSNLKTLNLIDTLNNEVLVKKKPILGICLGMQLFAKKSEEGNVNGLGWIDAEVVKFEIHNKLKYKIPHTGWNQVNIKKNSLLMTEIKEESEFYFVHSYHFNTKEKEIVLNETEYEYPIISAIENCNIFGVQYHPEKSHDVGEQLLKNFVNL